MLELKHPFGISVGSRTTTPAMLVEIERDGITGYGEASMPPYLCETQDSAAALLSKIDLDRYPDLRKIDEIIAEVDALDAENSAAKASFDIALHDWAGKRLGRPWHALWHLSLDHIPPTSFTIGIGSREEIIRGVREAKRFHVLKVKLGGHDDRKMIETIRLQTDKPVRIDVNQGWNKKEDALRMIEWLATKNVEFIEQPLPKEQMDDQLWLKERSPLPLVADESVQRLCDVHQAVGLFDGVNVKLMKATGMHEAHAMMLKAKEFGLRVMLGCMTETSCAISAAAQLSPLADWIDLDGALLVGNDPFEGATLRDGAMVPTDLPGIGVRKKERDRAHDRVR